MDRESRSLRRDTGMKRTLTMISLFRLFTLRLSQSIPLPNNAASFQISRLFDYSQSYPKLGLLANERLFEQQMSAFSAQPIVIDGKGHLLGRLASVVAKQVSVSENIF